MPGGKALGSARALSGGGTGVLALGCSTGRVFGCTGRAFGCTGCVCGCSGLAFGTGVARKAGLTCAEAFCTWVAFGVQGAVTGQAAGALT